MGVLAASVIAFALGAIIFRLSDALRPQQESGKVLVRPVDPRLATRTLLCSLNAVDTWFRPQADQPEADVEALAAALVDLVVGGLLPATAPPSPVRPG